MTTSGMTPIPCNHEELIIPETVVRLLRIDTAFSFCFCICTTTRVMTRRQKK